MGRTIAAVLEPKAANKRTHLEGEQYIITWAIGHLVSLAEPDQYDARYKKWNANDLPIIPDAFKLWPNPRTKDQLKVIGDLAKRCGRLVNACDAGREGQLIFHLIRDYLKLSQPTDRLWISDLTPETIRKGFSLLKSDEDYAPLTRAARARSQADWLIGMNASRAFTIRHRALLSVGRVQTPVLALLYDRHMEMTAFQSETFFVVRASFEQGDFVYQGVWQGDRLTDKTKAEALAAKVSGKPGEISEYTVNESKEYPYRLYDLTLLQREANGRYGYSAKKTLDIAQALYEKHKVITYPRTNSNYVTEENLPVMGKVLTMLQGTAYSELANYADRSRVHKGNKAVCNPSKVEDHHAILPTPKKASGLSSEEQNVYDMIVRRFLSHYYPPAVYKNHTVLTVVEEEIFRTKAKEQLDPGWKVVQQQQDQGGGSSRGKSKKKGSEDGDGSEEEELLTDRPFSIDADVSVHCRGAEAAEKATQPPKSYTEGTLLKAMESAGKSMEDDELREAMKDTGLGTPATRAATIERLKQVGYMTLAGKKLEITSKGIAAIQLIRGAGVELLASPEMTGRWEQRLYQISRGDASDGRFMEQVKQFAAFIVDKVQQQQQAAPGTFDEPDKPAGRGGKSSARGAGAGRGSKGSTTGAGKTRGARSGTSNGADEGPAPGKTKGASARGARGITGSGGAPAGQQSASQGTARETAASQSQTSGAIAATTPDKPQRSFAEPIASCPRTGCHGRIIEGKRGFGCSAYREGCTFVVWKEYQGKTVTLTMMKSLVEKGATSLLTFKDLGNGSPGKGRLVLIDRNKGTLQIRPE